MQLFLHIGMQKTGTSALQYFFDENREKLRSDNIDYPEISQFERIQFNGISYHNIIAASLGGFRSAFPKLSENGVTSLRQYVLQSEASVLFSGEDFSRLSELTALRVLLNGIQTKIIIYLREQASWVQSLYNQRNKILLEKFDDRLFDDSMLTEQDLFNFLQQEKYAPLMHYDRVIQLWSSVFGRENIIVRIFSADEFAGRNLIIDFMDAIGIYDLSKYKLPPRINDNIANAWFEIIKEIDRTHGRRAAKILAKRVSDKARGGHVSLSGPTDLLRDRVKRKLYSDYSKGNSWIAKEYFSRDDLFRT